MNKKIISLLFVMSLIFSIGCEKPVEKTAKKEEKKISTQKAGNVHEAAGHGVSGHEKAKKREVVVSKEIREAWKEAKLYVKNKETGTSKVYTVALHSDLKIQDTKLVVKVGSFIPDFSMAPGTITSKSKDLNNPALQVTIMEGEKEAYKGWLFSKFPDMHPFEHSKYSIILAEEMFLKKNESSKK